MDFRTPSILLALSAAFIAAYSVSSGQSAALQRPPRITGGSLVKPTVTPGKFKVAELPLTFTPAKPITPYGAIFGQAQFDLTEDSIRLVGNETGNFLGVKVLLASPNRPVTFEFEIYAKSQKKLGVEHKVGMTVGEYKGNGSLNSSVISLQDLKQTISITATPTKEGWVLGTVSPISVGCAFEVLSITVRQG